MYPNILCTPALFFFVEDETNRGWNLLTNICVYEREISGRAVCVVPICGSEIYVVCCNSTWNWALFGSWTHVALTYISTGHKSGSHTGQGDSILSLDMCWNRTPCYR